MCRRALQRAASLALSLLATAPGLSAAPLDAGAAGDAGPSATPQVRRTTPRRAVQGWQPQSQVLFLDEELLTNPTHGGITISLIAGEEADVRVEYGRASIGFEAQTPIQSVARGERAMFVLTGLEPSTRYVYRVLAREAGASGFAARVAYDFVTMRLPDETFSFAFGTDGHVYQLWANSNCGRSPNVGMRAFERTLENILQYDVDWFVTTGDEVQTHCVACDPCTVEGENAGMGTVQNLREAELRYQVMMSPLLYGRITKTVPFFYALGNHDGEQGYGDPLGNCGHFDTTDSLSEAARLAYLPNPADAYPGGNSQGTYFSFESGDALFVVLDVFKYTTAYPQAATDWTLGSEQLVWLAETLESSQHQWKFVLAHHLVGGAEDIGTCYYYGRGGIRSTHDGTPRGFFLGEQATLHTLLVAFGATAFLYGHDHIAIAGQKQGVAGGNDGVHYIQGGQSGHRPPGWIDNPDFRAEMDWNEDGVADFYELPARNATIERGFFVVTVEGKDRVRFDYIASDAFDAAANGRTVFSYVID